MSLRLGQCTRRAGQGFRASAPLIVIILLALICSLLVALIALRGCRRTAAQATSPGNPADSAGSAGRGEAERKPSDEEAGSGENPGSPEKSDGTSASEKMGANSGSSGEGDGSGSGSPSPGGTRSAAGPSGASGSDASAGRGSGSADGASSPPGRTEADSGTPRAGAPGIGDLSPRTSPPSADEKRIWEIAKKEVRGLLKRPDTATFPDLGSPGTRVERVGYGHYRATGHVTATNSLGKAGRAPFAVDIQIREQDTYLADVDIGDSIAAE